MQRRKARRVLRPAAAAASSDAGLQAAAHCWALAVAAGHACSSVRFNDMPYANNCGPFFEPSSNRPDSCGLCL